MKVRKILGIMFVIVLLVGSVSGVVVKIRYSTPTHRDGSEIIYEDHTEPIKQDCPSDEWNSNFDDYRSGEISKEEMIKYVGGCK